MVDEAEMSFSANKLNLGIANLFKFKNVGKIGVPPSVLGKPAELCCGDKAQYSSLGFIFHLIYQEFEQVAKGIYFNIFSY